MSSCPLRPSSSASSFLYCIPQRSCVKTMPFVGALACCWPDPLPNRSEEHTSELQSLMRISYAVFCLKKKYRPTTYSHLRRTARTATHHGLVDTSALHLHHYQV